jgi:chromosomal replication initiator protein
VRFRAFFCPGEPPAAIENRVNYWLERFIICPLVRRPVFFAAFRSGAWPDPLVERPLAFGGAAPCGAVQYRDGSFVIEGVVHLDLPPSELPAAAPGAIRSFVAGPENSLIALPLERLFQVDELAEVARRFNPLVLVGPSGSGKSQLVQGVVRHWRRRLGAERVEYFTAADFGRQCQAATAEGRAGQWRRHIRSLLVLVVEDLDRLRRRDTIQQDLRISIDAVLDGGGIVIATAEREPGSLSQLDTGLRDRLAEGLAVRVQRPALAAREAIVRLAAQARGLTLADDDIARLARREAATAAELLGRVARKAVISDDSDGGCDQLALLKQIVGATARYFGVSQASLVGPSRRISLVQARNVAAYLARRLTTLSYAQIGRRLGGRDHTTIMHAERRLTAQLAQDATLQQAVDELDRLLR